MRSRYECVITSHDLYGSDNHIRAKNWMILKLSFADKTESDQIRFDSIYICQFVAFVTRVHYTRPMAMILLRTFIKLPLAKADSLLGCKGIFGHARNLAQIICLLRCTRDIIEIHTYICSCDNVCYRSTMVLQRIMLVCHSMKIMDNRYMYMYIFILRCMLMSHCGEEFYIDF